MPPRSRLIYPESSAPGESYGGVHPTAGLPGYPAIDFFAPPGTPVVAPEPGVVLRFSGHDPREGSHGAAGIFGWTEYVRGLWTGAIYFITHLGSRSVRVGQRVGQGQELGTVGDFPDRPDHIHLGISGYDPRQLAGAPRIPASAVGHGQGQSQPTVPQAPPVAPPASVDPSAPIAPPRPGGANPSASQIGYGPDVQEIGWHWSQLWSDRWPWESPTGPQGFLASAANSIPEAIRAVAATLSTIAWLAHPVNILRAFETLFGSLLILIGLYWLGRGDTDTPDISRPFSFTQRVGSGAAQGIKEAGMRSTPGRALRVVARAGVE